MTPFVSDALLEAADLLLPVGTFAETSGTYVNVEGIWQSFGGIASPVGESRPAWKVLRVIGNLVDADGFDYVTSEDVLAECKKAVGDVEPAAYAGTGGGAKAKLGRRRSGLGGHCKCPRPQQMSLLSDPHAAPLRPPRTPNDVPVLRPIHTQRPAAKMISAAHRRAFARTVIGQVSFQLWKAYLSLIRVFVKLAFHNGAEAFRWMPGKRRSRMYLLNKAGN